VGDCFMKIAVVTDSTADLPADLLERRQIESISNLVIIDGQSLVDGKDITRQDFYERLPAMSTPPTTATTSAGDYQQVYERLLQNGADYIVSIHASSKLSGIFNTASLAAKAFNDRVHVVDSGQLSLGVGFPVLAAAEAAAAGSELPAVLEAAASVIRRVHVVAMLDTLEYVRRSGRVSWARARLGNLLRIKPFVELKNGMVSSLGEARTRRKGIERLLALLHGLGPLERLAILHTHAEADARQLLTDFNPQLEDDPLIIYVTTVIGTHIGPNALGFAAVTSS
jgi:DegV family protein with EDD domain